MSSIQEDFFGDLMVLGGRSTTTTSATSTTSIRAIHDDVRSEDHEDAADKGDREDDAIATNRTTSPGRPRTRREPGETTTLKAIMTRLSPQAFASRLRDARCKGVLGYVFVVVVDLRGARVSTDIDGYRSPRARRLSLSLSERPSPTTTTARSIRRRFIAEFVRDVRNSEMTSEKEDEDPLPGRVRAFVTRTASHLRAHDMFQDATTESIREGVEKFVTSKIYKRVFGSDPRDAADDAALRDRIRVLASFVTLHHLDLEDECNVDEAAWRDACDVLRTVDKYKSPRDKLVVISNCCQYVNGILAAETSAVTNEITLSEDRNVGADTFLPALIYVVLKSNPPRLCSNLRFVRAYRHPSLLKLSQRYHFTALESAVQFVRDVREGQRAFSMDPSEFRAHVKASVARLARDEADATRRRRERERVRTVAETMLSAPLSPIGDAPSTSTNDEKDMPLLALDEDDATETIARLADVDLAAATTTTTWRFRNADAGRLRMDEIPALLDEYKRLVRTCEALWRERERVLATSTNDGDVTRAFPAPF